MLQPERPEIEDVDTVVVAAYGLLIPESLLERSSVAERPSVAAAALARRGAGRARDHGRRPRDRRHDPRTVKELDAGPIAAQAAFAIEDEDDAGAVFARAAELAADLLEGVLAKASRRSSRSRRRA